MSAAWWGDKEYPPSIVLGIGKDVGSTVFGVTSGIALLVGMYCVAQSNLLTSFEGFEPQDNLVELHVEDNLIESFRSAPPPFSRAAPARPPAHPPAPP